MNNEMKKQKAFEVFQSKCDKMIKSKFLLAQPCIAGVLKCIIASPDLYQFIKDCIRNIDCENELYKATIEHNNERTFIMPKSKRIIIALVTYMLNQFDNNEIDLMDFVSYYYNEDTNIGYQEFCKDIIIPYCKACKDLFLNKIDKDDIIEIDKPVKIKSIIFENTDTLLKNIITHIQADNGISEYVRKEYIELVEGMMVALSDINRKVIVAIWIGMKYTFIKNKKIMKLLKELEKILKNHLLI